MPGLPVNNAKLERYAIEVADGLIRFRKHAKVVG